MKGLGLAAVLAVLGSAAGAGAIEQACLGAQRGASPALCGCIQQVADITLTSSDQRLAATFFTDPQKAQDIRQSPSRSHSVFWEKYKAFGETAEVYCQPAG